MKKQIAFNKVVRGLLKQNKQSFAEDGGACAYRGEGNTRCAVGFCLPNRLYFAALDTGNYGVKDLYRTALNKTLRKRLILIQAHLKIEGLGQENTIKFWSELQELHDDIEPELWKDSLREFGAENKLDTSCIDEFK